MAKLFPIATALSLSLFLATVTVLPVVSISTPAFAAQKKKKSCQQFCRSRCGPINACIAQCLEKCHTR
jgi:hypothetical protein